ncbi:MAG: biopolymer transporter ExbD [Bacteroidales bacterium]|nr:biopolymer transporter ExbD [Bacteroidales bacterium]
MAKIKVAKGAPRTDMTPMVDMFMLLLTFFMLTATFRPQEPTQVDMPNSISEKLIPERNAITVFIGKDNKVFFNIDNGEDSTLHIRQEVLKNVGQQFDITFTYDQLSKFERMDAFGMPVSNIAEWIDAPDQSTRDKLQVGIPVDSTNNELAMWILYSRKVNPKAEATIRGDNIADYKAVKKVLDIFQEAKINKFNLVTNLEKVEVSLENL